MYISNLMNQEKVWDAIGVPWKKFRNQPIEQVVDFLKNKRGKILDLGCGSGRSFSTADGVKFYGVDFSQGMLDKARERCDEEGFDAELKKSGADNIPYGDEFFDFGIYIAALHCIDSAEARQKSLEELYRVIKKGGEVLVTVWSRNQKRVKNSPKETMVPWTIEDKKYMRYYYIYEREEFEKLLKDVGFEIVKIWEDMNINAVVRK
jgi:tRNA (uracil-5-)-methyltransferase TRM9